MLAQIVSPASPTYMYGLVLGDEIAGEALINAPKARPYVGVISRSAGFTFVEVHNEERTVRFVLLYSEYSAVVPHCFVLFEADAISYPAPR